MSKQTMQQLTEHFKFSSRHGGIRTSFSLRPILRWPRPSGLDQRRIGAADENLVLIRFYRKKFTLAVFGYSDIILVPRKKMDEWCRYLEVMATWQMFVELAIPTAIFLIKDASVSFAHATPYKTGNVWFPQNPAHFSRISAIINQMLDECGSDIAGLDGAFPKEYLYLHPVKLSRFA